MRAPDFLSVEIVSPINPDADGSPWISPKTNAFPFFPISYVIASGAFEVNLVAGGFLRWVSWVMPTKTKTLEVAEADKTFYDDLKELRAKYPMCYLEAWTPEDFDLDENGEPKDEVDWKSRVWKRVAARLGHEFDASVGTNWERVGEVTKRICAKH